LRPEGLGKIYRASENVQPGEESPIKETTGYLPSKVPIPICCFGLDLQCCAEMRFVGAYSGKSVTPTGRSGYGGPSDLVANCMRCSEAVNGVPFDAMMSVVADKLDSPACGQRAESGGAVRAVWGRRPCEWHSTNPVGSYPEVIITPAKGGQAGKEA
jgi:hypothetical protein